MARGFFPQSVVAQSKAPMSLVPKCGACGLYKGCRSPKMAIDGKGRKGILVVGEAPGETEDDEGRPFVGKMGKELKKILARFDISLREDCWITNALICHPPDNRDPSDDEIDYCRPNLLKTIQELKPEKILLLGGPATQSLIGYLWKGGGDIGSIGRWRGWQIPDQKYNAWICPTWHPSFVFREDYGVSKEANDVRALIWGQDLEAFAELRGRPWEEVPNYESQVEKLLDPNLVRRVLNEFIEAGGAVAFDYETNMLKPDSDKAQIISCSVCWEGKRTIAYPWHGAAVEATKEMLLSPLFKTGHNIKFEDRWSRAKLGIEIQNWRYCSMNGAHLYDNRPDITGLKFQAFVWLGLGSYDEHIKGSLRASSGGINQAQGEISITDLLRYNGLDSLVQFHVAKKHLEALGWQDLLRSSK